MSEPLAPERRAMLSLKGQLLYGKYCGTGGQGICAENFALYHLRRGEREVADDLCAFLTRQCEFLESDDPEGRLSMTRALLARVREHLTLA